MQKKRLHFGSTRPVRRSAITALMTAAGAVLCGFASSAYGATAYWDSNGSADGAGTLPTGTWGVGSFWNASSDGTAALGAWNGGDTAVFSAGTDATSSFNVTVSGVQTANGLKFEEGVPTLTGGEIDLTGPGVDVASTASPTISTILGGSVGLTKTGPGTLTLTAPNTYTGGTAINAGTLSTNRNLGAANSSVVVTAPGTLVLGGTISNVVTGTGTINTGSNGATTITGDMSTFAGSFTHNSTTASTSFNSSNATSKDAAYVLASAQGNSQGFVVGSSTIGTLKLGSLSGVSGSLFQGGSAANFTYTTTQIEIGNLNTNTTFAGSINNGSNVSPIPLGITKMGTGTLTLSGANEYSGSTNVRAGTLVASSNTALGFGGNNPLGTGASTSIFGGATLDLAGATIVNEAISMSGTSSSPSLIVSSGSTTLSNGLAEIRFGLFGSGFNGGSGAVTLSGGGGTGAAAVYTASGSEVSAIRVTNAGSGYTSVPTVSFPGGAQQPATAVLSGIVLFGANSKLGGDGNLTIAASIRDTGGNGGGFTKVGAGTVTLTGINTYIGVTGVSAGKLAIIGNLTSSTSTVISGGTLELTTGGGGNRVMTTHSLVMTGGKIDLKDNKLIFINGTPGSWNGSNYTGLIGHIRSGRNDGAWNGVGIVTSMTAAASPNFLTTLAIATAGDVGKSIFGGISVSPTDMLVMYTYTGDANLDGKVNADDYFQIDSHFNRVDNASKSYFNGDFNYDGKINGDDYFLIDNAFVSQGSPFGGAASAGGVTAVPEPALGLLIFLGGLPLCRNRSRRI